MGNDEFVLKFDEIMRHFSTPQTCNPDDEIIDIVANLSNEERDAILPCSPVSRKSLLKKGLAHWSRRHGHSHDSIKLSNKGYRVRDYMVKQGLIDLGKYT
jgi:hypothetical protein